MMAYTGPHCSNCEERYGLIDDFQCVSCSNYFSYFKTLIIFLIRLLIFIASVRKILNTNRALISNDQKDKHFQMVESMKSSFYLNILGYHFQILALLLRYNHLDLSVNLKDILSIGVSSFSQDFQSIFSQECLMKAIGLKNYIPVQ